MVNSLTNKHAESGYIESFFSGVARISGIPSVFLHEILVDRSGALAAIVIGFNKDTIDALFFDEEFDLSEPVFRSKESFSVSIADNLKGRIIDGIGHPRDGLGRVSGEHFDVFKKAPAIIDRQPLSVPLSTGIKIIDTSLPLGRGQRELIIGDRKLGKSTTAVDVILNQKHADPPVYCIYVISGHKEQKLQDIATVFEDNNTFLYTTIVAATSGDSFASQYLAPFVGCTIGEYFRDRGEDALVVYDDLSMHAKAYRDISLLLGRAPGREAYPGDIFSLHAGLLERAARLSEEKGGGSLTALPIIETQEGDISAFIPTNLISITDGQIYLERGLFQKGFMPAVNVGLSVSRVGSQVQPEPLKEVVGSVRLSLSQHKELQKLLQLETVISDETRKKIHRGELVSELLKQEKHTNISWEEQVILFYTVEGGFFDDIEKEKWKDFEALLLELVRNTYPDILPEIRRGELTQKIKEKIAEIVRDFKKEFISR